MRGADVSVVVVVVVSVGAVEFSVLDGVVAVLELSLDAGMVEVDEVDGVVVVVVVDGVVVVVVDASLDCATAAPMPASSAAAAARMDNFF